MAISEKEHSRRREYIIGGLALALTVALCVAVIFYWDYIRQAEQYGYFGAFVISVLAGATVFVPIPGILVVFTLGSVLNPPLVGIVSGLGEAVGSIGIYLSGWGGQKAVQNLNHKFVNRFVDWLRYRGEIAVFLMSAILNPLFYPFAAIAGMLRFGLTKFFFLCWAGKSLKNTAIAYLGYFGLRSVLRWVGVLGV
ncbi:MAG: VTT domain-containing protein [Dehalococcoidia bacterium]|nr:VTT domain-containing protein [Dehalococcoidia bacterium]